MRAQEHLILLVESSSSEGTEKRSVDEEEERKLAEFCATVCGCRVANGIACSLLFSLEHFAIMRGHAAELSWNEHNMAFMGQVMAQTHSDLETLNFSKYRHAKKEREESHNFLTPELQGVQSNLSLFAQDWGF